MTNSQVTIYPCGLIAQWIEHCTGIARSRVRVPFKPEFFQVVFSTAVVFLTAQFQQIKAHCDDHNFTHVYSQFTYI